VRWGLPTSRRFDPRHSGDAVWKGVRVLRKLDRVLTRIIFCHYNFWYPHRRIGQTGQLVLFDVEVEMSFAYNLGVILGPPSAPGPIAPRIIFDGFIVRIELMKTPKQIGLA
jgi:hypothetical protein